MSLDRRFLRRVFGIYESESIGHGIDARFLRKITSPAQEDFVSTQEERIVRAVRRRKLLKQKRR